MIHSSKPSRVRWRILALLFSISVVTYIDRVNISVTARQMMPALSLTDVQMGQVFSAFALGYALFQIPGGWLGDRWGPRWILTLAVFWWSVFTGLTAVAGTIPTAQLFGILGSLILVRFLIGVGESAALPNFNRAVTNWLAPRERGFGIGIAIGGIGVGAAMTPPLTAWIMVNYGWQVAFYAAGVLGIFIAVLWFLYATDFPEEHPQVNVQELSIIRGSEVRSPVSLVPTIPWKQIVRTPTIWWLVLSYTCLGYVAYIYMFWFYLYLVDVRGFGELRGAIYAMAPFLAMALFCPLGGWATDRLVERYGINIGRGVIGGLGMILSGLFIFFGAMTTSPSLAIGFLSLGAGWLYFTVGAFWSSIQDLSPTHAGSLSGLMNMWANLGGTLSPTLTPWIAQQLGWGVALGVAALVACCGGIMWIGIKPGRGLGRPTDT